MSKIKNSALKFILLLVGGGLVGFVGSMVLVFINEGINLHMLFNNLLYSVTQHHKFVQIVSALPFLVIISWVYLKSYLSILKGNLSEKTEDQVDKYLSIGVCLSTLAIILNFTIFGVLASQLTSSAFLASVVLFATISCLYSACEITGIKLMQKLHPEKKGDPLDLKFKKDWINSCDEGEKMITYVAGFKTFTLMNNVFVITFTIILILGFFLDLGVLPYILIGLLWGISAISHSYYAYRIEKGHIKY